MPSEIGPHSGTRCALVLPGAESGPPRARPSKGIVKERVRRLRSRKQRPTSVHEERRIRHAQRARNVVAAVARRLDTFTRHGKISQARLSSIIRYEYYTVQIWTYSSTLIYLKAGPSRLELFYFETLSPRSTLASPRPRPTLIIIIHSHSTFASRLAACRVKKHQED